MHRAWWNSVVRRLGAVRLFGVLTVSIFVLSGFQGVTVYAEHGGPGPDPQGNGEPEDSSSRVIGTFAADGEIRNLTANFAHSRGKALHIRAPHDAEDLRIDPAFVQQSVGDWAAKSRFSVAPEDGFIEVEGRAMVFVPLNIQPGNTFTMGSNASVRFADRPMQVTMRQVGQEIILDIKDGNTTGQDVFVSKTFLHSLGIHRPYARHGDGTSLAVTPSDDRTGFWIEMPHFSELVLGPEEILVYGRQAGVTVEHSGTVVWDPDDDALAISVGDKLTTYEVLVEVDWFDAFMQNVSLKGHAWATETYEGNLFYKVTLGASQTPATLEFLDFRPTQDELFTYGGMG